jgi:hypothetical protein
MRPNKETKESNKMEGNKKEKRGKPAALGSLKSSLALCCREGKTRRQRHKIGGSTEDEGYPSPSFFLSDFSFSYAALSEQDISANNKKKPAAIKFKKGGREREKNEFFQMNFGGADRSI